MASAARRACVCANNTFPHARHEVEELCSLISGRGGVRCVISRASFCFILSPSLLSTPYLRRISNLLVSWLCHGIRFGFLRWEESNRKGARLQCGSCCISSAMQLLECLVLNGVEVGTTQLSWLSWPQLIKPHVSSAAVVCCSRLTFNSFM